MNTLQPKLGDFELWMQNPVTVWFRNEINLLIQNEKSDMNNGNCFNAENQNLTQSLTANALGAIGALQNVLDIRPQEKIDDVNINDINDEIEEEL